MVARVSRCVVIAVAVGRPADRLFPATDLHRCRLPRPWPAHGWSQQTTAPGALLTAFADDRTYHLIVETTNPSAGVAEAIQFTLDDLRSLADGQVWAVPGPYADKQAMSREDFEKAAARSC